MERFTLELNDNNDTTLNQPCHESLLGQSDLFHVQVDGCKEQGRLKTDRGIVMNYGESCLITESRRGGKRVYTTQICKSFSLCVLD